MLSAARNTTKIAGVRRCHWGRKAAHWRGRGKNSTPVSKSAEAILFSSKVEEAPLPPRRCPYCQQLFEPSPCHPNQSVCAAAGCQRQRRADYRRRKLATDPAYADRCRQSARQWRKQHPDYWEQYRDSHPLTVVQNRARQITRDKKRRLAKLANNTLASNLIHCPATVWLLGAGLRELANNTLAPAQLWILEGLPRGRRDAPTLANNTPLVC